MAEKSTTQDGGPRPPGGDHRNRRGRPNTELRRFSAMPRLRTGWRALRNSCPRRRKIPTRSKPISAPPRSSATCRKASRNSSRTTPISRNMPASATPLPPRSGRSSRPAALRKLETLRVAGHSRGREHQRLSAARSQARAAHLQKARHLLRGGIARKARQRRDRTGARPAHGPACPAGPDRDPCHAAVPGG